MKPLSILLLLLVAGCTENENPKPGETWRLSHSDGSFYDIGDLYECKILKVENEWVQYCEKHGGDSKKDAVPIDQFISDHRKYDSPFLHDSTTKCDNP